MSNRKSNTQSVTNYFSVPQKLIHWIMAFLIVAMLIAGPFIADPDKELAERLWSRTMHGSGGLVVGALLIIRLVLRFWRGVPAEPSQTPAWQRVLSQLSHWGMYAIIAALVISGFLLGMFATAPMPLPILGGFDITLMENDSDGVFQEVLWYHSLITDIAIGFIAVHVVAAFYHMYCLKDKVMQRMAIFWRSRKTPMPVKDQAADEALKHE